jgi:predicted RNA polymerase sigma factor
LSIRLPTNSSPTWRDTDWSAIVSLYGVLLQLWPSPVVELNRAAAIGFRDGPQAGLDALAALSAEPALTLTDNDVERAFLTERLRRVGWEPEVGRGRPPI